MLAVAAHILWVEDLISLFMTAERRLLLLASEAYIIPILQTSFIVLDTPKFCRFRLGQELQSTNCRVPCPYS